MQESFLRYAEEDVDWFLSFLVLLAGLLLIYQARLGRFWKRLREWLSDRSSK